MNVFRPALLFGALAVALTASAQRKPRADFALSYVADHSNPVGPGGNFWLQGGSAELGVNAWHGFGIAANVTGTHTAGFGPNAIPVTLITTTFGPRYRYILPSEHKEISLFGEGMIGEVHGLNSIYPSPAGLTSDALSFAVQAGGGIDIGFSHHFAVRAIQANWVRTQLPNSTTNVQNHLMLGAGVVVKF